MASSILIVSGGTLTRIMAIADELDHIDEEPLRASVSVLNPVDLSRGNFAGPRGYLPRMRMLFPKAN